MNKLLIILTLLCFGCAFSGAKHKEYNENGKLIAETKCWNIVFGDGEIGILCLSNGTIYIASQDTGFSDKAAPTFKAIGEAGGAAAKCAVGIP